MKRRNYMTGMDRFGQRGVGLIEVLIALLVLSFGMLGLAGLQMWSLRYNQSAMERGMAVVQTHSIADAMRADRAAALAQDFDIALNAEVAEGSTFALVSLRTWRQSVRDVLGEDATGEVDCNGPECTIRVQWNDDRATTPGPADEEDDGPTMQTVTTVVML